MISCCEYHMPPSSILKTFALFFLGVSLVNAATITGGSFSSIISNDPSLPSQLIFNSIVTNQFSFSMGFGGGNAPFVPVPLNCGANGLQTPCTLSSGTTYSSTWSNLTRDGLTLAMGGNTYTYQYGTAQAWHVTLNFTPVSTVTFAFGGPNSLVMANVTGSLYATDSFGVVIVNEVPLVGLAQMGIGARQGPTTGSTTVYVGAAPGVQGSGALFINQGSTTPEPSTFGIVGIGLAIAMGRKRRRNFSKT